ncbi:hypothetical protein [Pedobacter nyackensis]|uniref:hypothetical protein n=1 Tax=Pedobacter nyackensis TaxID=475255 RepID=UPI00292D85BA|nr:hypothetical protein [Pedobacter nyackensis]
MRTTILLSFLLLSTALKAQIVEVYNGSPRLGAAQQKDVELFGKGLLDYGFEGQFQATTQAVKIHIGEPNKFYIPVYLLVGATTGDFGKDELNKSAILSLLNPSGGLLNLNGNGYVRLTGSETSITSVKLTSTIGAKLLTGRNSVDNSSLIKPVYFADPGVYFQTGAWDPGTGYQDGGIFWLQAKYALFGMAKKDLQEFFGSAVNDIPQGIRFEMGCFVKDRVNIKLSYFKAVSGKDIPTLNDGQFRLALDYSVFK